MECFTKLTGKPTGKRPLGKPTCIWEDSIRMELKEIDISTRNCVDSAQDRGYWKPLGNAALNLRIPRAMELLVNCKIPV